MKNSNSFNSIDRAFRDCFDARTYRAKFATCLRDDAINELRMCIAKHRFIQNHVSLNYDARATLLHVTRNDVRACVHAIRSRFDVTNDNVTQSRER